jgi:hypothetical protein
MPTDRRRQLVLSAVLVVLAFVLYRAWTAAPASPASSSNGRTRAARAANAVPDAVPDVRLQALDGQRPTPVPGDRNLFDFGRPAPPPPSARPSVAPPPVVRPGPAMQPGSSGPGPIPLKFIGIVEAPAQAKRIAALVDAGGHAFQGAEGDIVAGQYRILRIGVESIEMAHLDGRGRQTIRLSGS